MTLFLSTWHHARALVQKPSPIAVHRIYSRWQVLFPQKHATPPQTWDRSTTSMPVAACSIRSAPQCTLRERAHRNLPSSAAETFAASARKPRGDIGAHLFRDNNHGQGIEDLR